MDRSQNFEMIEGKKVSAMSPKSWKKSFNNGVNIPAKMRFCNESTDKLTCNSCNYQVSENKELEANLNELKQQPPNEFSYMFPYYEEKDDLFRILVQFCFVSMKNFSYFNKFLFNKWMV